jgi:hypothetical protein
VLACMTRKIGSTSMGIFCRKMVNYNTGKCEYETDITVRAKVAAINYKSTVFSITNFLFVSHVMKMKMFFRASFQKVCGNN